MIAHAKEAWAVAFSPDRQTLATSSDDNTINIHDLSTRKVRHSLVGHGNLVMSIAYSPDGQTIASGDFYGNIFIWNALIGGNKILQWKAHSTGEERSTGTNRVAFSPDGSILASVGRDSKVVLWDWRTGKMLNSITINNNRSYTLAFSPDSKALMVGARECIEGFELPSLARKARSPDHSFSMPLALWLDRGHAAIGTHGGRLTLLDEKWMPYLSVQAHDTEINALAVSPDCRTLATGSVDGQIRLWHQHTGNLLAELTTSGPQINGLAYSPDGRQLASCDHSGAVTLWLSKID
jgi:WD40 repeat protein